MFLFCCCLLVLNKLSVCLSLCSSHRVFPTFECSAPLIPSPCPPRLQACGGSLVVCPRTRSPRPINSFLQSLVRFSPAIARHAAYLLQAGYSILILSLDCCEPCSPSSITNAAVRVDIDPLRQSTTSGTDCARVPL
jgi:hypothetical protein